MKFNGLRFNQYWGFGKGFEVPMVDMMDAVSKLPQHSGRGSSGGSSKTEGSGYKPGGLTGADAQGSAMYYDAEMKYNIASSELNNVTYQQAMYGNSPELEQKAQQAQRDMIESQYVMHSINSTEAIRKSHQDAYNARKESTSNYMSRIALGDDLKPMGLTMTPEDAPIEIAIANMFSLDNETVYQQVDLQQSGMQTNQYGLPQPFWNANALPFSINNSTTSYKDVLRGSFNDASKNMYENSGYLFQQENGNPFFISQVGVGYVLNSGTFKRANNKNQLENLVNNPASFLNKEQIGMVVSDGLTSMRMKGRFQITTAIPKTAKTDAELKLVQASDFEKKRYINLGYRVVEKTEKNEDGKEYISRIYVYDIPTLMYKTDANGEIMYQMKDGGAPVTVSYENGEEVFKNSAGKVVSKDKVAPLKASREDLDSKMSNFAEAYLTYEASNMVDSYQRKTEDVSLYTQWKNDTNISVGGNEKEYYDAANYYMAHLFTNSTQASINMGYSDPLGGIFSQPMRMNLNVAVTNVTPSGTDEFGKNPLETKGIAFDISAKGGYIAYNNTYYPVKYKSKSNTKNWVTELGFKIADVTGTGYTLPQVMTNSEAVDIFIQEMPRYFLSKGSAMGELMYSTFGLEYNDASKNKWLNSDEVFFTADGYKNWKRTYYDVAIQDINTTDKQRAEYKKIRNIMESSFLPYQEFRDGNINLMAAKMQYTNKLDQTGLFSHEEIAELGNFFAMNASAKVNYAKGANDVFQYSTAFSEYKGFYGGNAMLGSNEFMTDTFNKAYQMDGYNQQSLDARMGTMNPYVGEILRTDLSPLQGSDPFQHYHKLANMQLIRIGGGKGGSTMTVEEFNRTYNVDLIKEIKDEGAPDKDKSLAAIINATVYELSGGQFTSPFKDYKTFKNITSTDYSEDKKEDMAYVLFLETYTPHNVEWATTVLNRESDYGYAINANSIAFGKLGNFFKPQYSRQKSR